jgi:hypothetical protein
MMLSLRSASYHFLKKKKKKERLIKSGGFKRSQVYLKKYYPTIAVETDLVGGKKELY